MDIKAIFETYFKKQIDAITLIRTVSGIFEPKQAVNLLALINSICRLEQGDLDVKTFREIWKMGEKES